MKRFRLKIQFYDHYDGVCIRTIYIEANKKSDVTMGQVIKKISSLSNRYFACNFSNLKVLEFEEIDEEIHESILEYM